MNNKKIVISFFCLVSIILIIGSLSIRLVKNMKQDEMLNEYIPQEEISDEQQRHTIVSLYFVDKETNSIKPEARLIDVKELVTEPYNVLVNCLIDGPKNGRLVSAIPQNTKLLGSSLDGECLVLDFSVELLNYDKDNQNEKDNLIYSIVNTVTELKEVNKVKILINGEINDEIKDEYVRL